MGGLALLVLLALLALLDLLDLSALSCASPPPLGTRLGLAGGRPPFRLGKVSSGFSTSCVVLVPAAFDLVPHVGLAPAAGIVAAVEVAGFVPAICTSLFELVLGALSLVLWPLTFVGVCAAGLLAVLVSEL